MDRRIWQTLLLAALPLTAVLLGGCEREVEQVPPTEEELESLPPAGAAPADDGFSQETGEPVDDPAEPLEPPKAAPPPEVEPSETEPPQNRGR